MVAVAKQKGLLVNIKMAFIFCKSESVTTFLALSEVDTLVFYFIYIFLLDKGLLM